MTTATVQIKSASDKVYKYENSDLVARVLRQNLCANFNTLLELSPSAQAHGQKHRIHVDKKSAFNNLSTINNQRIHKTN